ncbi:DUF305 domain-containing protein [Nostoc sp. FACHB-110]|nr:DUF305 domain-containing protein [Nostoc sp. FACHB-110]
MGVHHSKGQAMQGMSMHSEMMGIKRNLESLKNASDFDKEFVRQMIPPVMMSSRMVANHATHREIRNLAEEIFKSQTAEFPQM